MASAQSILVLQNPSFKWKNHSHHSPQLLPLKNYFCRVDIKIRKSSVKKLSVNYLFTTNNNSAVNQRVSKISLGEWETKQNPVEIMAETVMNMLRALRKPAVAALVLGLLLMFSQNSALAASGGRMGGSSFSSSGSGSYSAWSSDDDDYSTSGSRDYTTPLSEEDKLVANIILIIGAIILAVGLYAQVEADTVKTSVLKLQLVTELIKMGVLCHEIMGCVVGLLGSAKSLQKELNSIAETADTSASSKGLHYVMTETVVALLRHTDYCISGYSSVDVKGSIEAGEKKFNQLSVEERGKIDEETLVNVNNIKKKSSTILKADGFSNEYIVVTILVAAEGEHKLPPIKSSKDLKEALHKLASITSSRTKAVEVFWTPQKQNDTLSEQELRKDYPLLRPLQ